MTEPIIWCMYCGAELWTHSERFGVCGMCQDREDRDTGHNAPDEDYDDRDGPNGYEGPR